MIPFNIPPRVPKCSEYVLEAMYSLQINDYWKLVPHLQYIKDPAYSGESDAVIMGVQAVFSF